MNKKERTQIAKLFMEDSDKLALEKLYKITKDPLIKVILNWKKQYEIELDNCNSNEFYMYDDTISYILKRYQLD